MYKFVNLLFGLSTNCIDNPKIRFGLEKLYKGNFNFAHHC